jgi:hypothetical protein
MVWSRWRAEKHVLLVKLQALACSPLTVHENVPFHRRELTPQDAMKSNLEARTIMHNDDERCYSSWTSMFQSLCTYR